MNEGKFMEDNIKRFTVRLPKELHAALFLQACKSNRTLHGQLLHILTKNLKTKKAAEGTVESASTASVKTI